MEDMELLREYALKRSESAFAALVDRHVGNWFIRPTLRQLHDVHLAEDVTQAVFVILARKADRLSHREVLSGSLVESHALCGQCPNPNRHASFPPQTEAYMQSTLNEPSFVVWEQLAPLLDEAMASLGDIDRNALALRFFENKTGPEIAKELKLNEAAAKKRITRALEKLQRFFLRHGVDSTTAIIAGAISANSVQAAPVALAKSVTAAAIAKGTTASSSTLALIKGVLKIMAWTKTKTTIIAGVVLLLAAGATVTVVVSENNARQTEKLWRVNKDLSRAQIDSLPPMVKVLPTKFPPVWVNWNSGAKGDKFVGANAPAGTIAVYAYGFPIGRIHFADLEPTNRFDFVATLPQGSREALQRELKAKLGLVGRVKTEDQDVLVLRVAHPNAPGLRPAILGKNDTYSKPGIYHSSNVAIETGAPRFEGLTPYLERYFKMPVIDETGLTQYYGIDLRWREEPGHLNPEGLKQSLLDRLGLELVPARMPVEILEMEKAG